MSKNVDKDQVFEFLRVASLDPTNPAALREAYWVIWYIFLQKTQQIDISESFAQGGKFLHMLKEINISKFQFYQGFLEYEDRKVSYSQYKPITD